MIDAKVSLLNQLREGMSATLTVQQMDQLMLFGRELLDGFDVTELGIRNEENDDLLESYVAAMQVECRSQKTIDRYVYIIKKMMKYAKVTTRRINVYHLRQYMAAEKARGIQDSTLEGYRQIFSAYFNWLQRESLIDRNPTANLGTVKVAKKHKETISDIEMEKLNRACRNNYEWAMLHFLRSTGCRVSEMTGLDRNAIEAQARDTGMARCKVCGKGNKERYVYLDGVAITAVWEYLKERKDDNPALFVNRFGERLKPDGVRFVLNEMADRAGVEHIHPHKFRRTLATEMVRRGMQVQEAARVLGHENLDTTMMYVNMNDDDIEASYRRYA